MEFILNNYLLIFITISIALTIAFFAIRGRYIHDFRTYGLDFSDNWSLYKASKDRKTADTYKKIAKSRIIHSLQYKCKALFWTFSIAYMSLAFIFLLLAIVFSFIPLSEIILFFLALPFAVLAIFVIIFENHLHSSKRKEKQLHSSKNIWGKICKRVMRLNFLVSRKLQSSPLGINYLSSWGEIKEPFENKKSKIKSKNELKKFIGNEKNDYFIQPLNEYNLLPWSPPTPPRSSTIWLELGKIFALLLTVIFGSWVWTYYRPLFPTVVIALAGVGALILIWKH